MAGLPNFVEGAAFGVLNDLLSAFRSNEGFARPNRFEVLIFAPPKLGGGGQQNIFNNQERQSDAREISLRAQTVQLPGRNLMTNQDVNIYGPERDVVEGISYAEGINIQFVSSSGLKERIFFENWQKQSFNEKTWNLGYYNDYVANAEIYLLDEQDQRRYGIKLWEIFPKTIPAVNLGQDLNDEIINIEVEFSFRYWTNLDQKQNPDVNIFDRVFNTVVNSAEREINRNIPKVLNRL